jgi:hypothetical protein
LAGSFYSLCLPFDCYQFHFLCFGWQFLLPLFTYHFHFLYFGWQFLLPLFTFLTVIISTSSVLAFLAAGSPPSTFGLGFGTSLHKAFLKEALNLVC